MLIYRLRGQRFGLQHQCLHHGKTKRQLSYQAPDGRQASPAGMRLLDPHVTNRRFWHFVALRRSCPVTELLCGDVRPGACVLMTRMRPRRAP